MTELCPPRSLPKLPCLIAHADWGREAKKRWMARAGLKEGCYHLSVPELVGDCGNFFSRLRNGLHREGSILVGFDFPIGLPETYASSAGLSDFLSALPQLGYGQWKQFFDVARTKQEISIHRPFYPNAPGGKRMADLVSQLHLTGKDHLLRRCERKTTTRPAACPLFWTLGSKQVGKAAIAGWSELLSPAFRPNDGALAIWPFSGQLGGLVGAYAIVVAETYPAEAYRHLGFPRTRWSKRVQSGRRARAKEIKEWAAQRPVVLEPPTLNAINDGFGPRKDGEDPFDALVGLCSMLDVALGYRTEGVPNAASVRRVEGWILGQQP